MYLMSMFWLLISFYSYYSDCHMSFNVFDDPHPGCYLNVLNVNVLVIDIIQ